MTVSATTTRNDYIATAGQTVFPYTFKVLDSTDLVVTKNGVVQSAYSVSGINVVTGGNVTFTSGVTANDAIAIYLAMPVTRDTNYQEGGAFLAGEVNSDFDKIYIGAIQNENAIDRSMRLPESEPTVSMTLPSKADRLGTVLGFNAVTGAPEAGPTIVAAGTIASIAADIETVAGISSNVVVVSGLQGNINNLGPISQDIIVVSEISSDVTALNTDPLKSNINTVAGISSDVTGVSGISAAVTAVNNSASTIASVNANLPKISIVAASDAEVTIVADNIADVVNVNADLTGDDTIGTVAGAIANVNTVGGNITNVNTVAGDTSAINAVNANAANINAVSANGTNISTVAGDTTAINSVAGAIPAITAVNTDPLKTNIANVNANSSNITAVANNAANINNVANNSASINTVAADGADIGTVAGISADVSSVANIAPNVTTVSGMETKIDTVIADAADIGTVAVNIGSVTTVAGISGDVTTVSGISTDVTSVADNMTAVQNAVTSATNAAASASSASTSASSAATSESNAAISAGNAATSASNAATSASNASASSASASNSANVASNASTSAASSAASAGSSDTNAAASAANAAASAVNASNSEIAAASSATDSSVAASTWNSYYSTYLGAAASAPSTDLLGQSLQNGALYFNTTDDTMYVFNGTTWIAAESTINNVDWGGQLAGNLNTNGYDINFGDNDKAQFGAGNDLQIYHDGTNSYIEDTGTGSLIVEGTNLILRADDGSRYLQGVDGTSGVTRLYHPVDDAIRLATTSTGIDVTGTATMDGLVVDGDSTIKGGSGVGNDTATLQLESTETQAIGSGASVSFKGDDGTGSRRTFGVIKGSKTSAASGDFSGGLDFFTRVTAQPNATKRLAINSNGDISFYEDTGITPKLVWDASAESLNFADNGKATFGAGNDLQIYHDGSNSYIVEQGTGNLRIAANDFELRSWNTNETYMSATTNGEVSLRFNNAAKLATTATGIDVTGSVVANDLTLGDSSPTLTFNDSDIANLNHYITSASNANLYYAADSAAVATGKHVFTTQNVERFKISATGIDVTGTATMDGLTVEGPSVVATINATSTNSGLQFTHGSTNLGVRDWSIRSNSNAFGDFIIKRESAYGSGIDTTTMALSPNGNVLFYEDTGTTPKFFWHASDESLGIGTSSPAAPLDVRKSTGDLAYFIPTTSGHGSTYISSSSNKAEIGTGLTNTEFSVRSKGNGGFLTFDTAGIERLRIDSAGHAIIPNGVTLGTAVGVYSAAKTLDDYEEGTWTPSLVGNITGGSHTYGYQNGKYTKVGNTVTASFGMYISTKDNTMDGNVLVSGLPISASMGTNVFASLAIGWAANITYGDMLGGYMNSGTSIALRLNNSATASPFLQSSAIGSGSVYLFGTITYQTA